MVEITITVALLSFKPLPKDIFDAQVSFNMLSQYGAEAPLSLEDIELKIDRHLASLLADGGAAMPSLRLIQAPVFHGYSISAWVEFEENPGMTGIFQALGSPNIDVRTKDHEPPPFPYFYRNGVEDQRGAMAVAAR